MLYAAYVHWVEPGQERQSRDALNMSDLEEKLSKLVRHSSENYVFAYEVIKTDV